MSEINYQALRERKREPGTGAQILCAPVPGWTSKARQKMDEQDMHNQAITQNYVQASHPACSNSSAICFSSGRMRSISNFSTPLSSPLGTSV